MTASARKGGANSAPPLRRLEKLLHLLDIGLFGFQQLVGQIPYPFVLPMVVVQVLEALGHAHGVALNHHVGNFGVRVPAVKLRSGHEIRQSRTEESSSSMSQPR